MATKYIGKRIEYKVYDQLYTGLVYRDNQMSDIFEVSRDVRIGERDVTDYIKDSDVIRQLN